MKRSIRIADDNAVVITGNRLTDGRIVWLNPSGAWTSAIAESQQMTPSEFFEKLVAARANAEACAVVDVYEVPIAPGQPPIPISMRERIRAFGPSIHPQFAPGSPL